MGEKERLILTGDPPKSRRRIMTPTLIAKAGRCLHAWALECFGDPAWKIEADAGLKMLWERGREYERQQVATLSEYREPVWDGEDWNLGYLATIDLMRQGTDWIYQGVLLGGNIAGKPDLMHKVEGLSRLGDFTYRPVDIKSHQKVDRKDKLQLATYAHLMDKVLGARPPTGAIWLSTGEIEDVPLDKLAGEFEDLLARMLSIRDGKGEATLGFRCSECTRCDWREHCQADWELRRCVSLVNGITGDLARKLYTLGFRSFDAIEQAGADRLVREAGLSEKSATSIILHARARTLGKPLPIKSLSPRNEWPIAYYDIETFGDTVYLHGLILKTKDQREEKQFVAKEPSEEGRAWHELLDYLALAKPRVVYTWTDFERGHVEGLWAHHGGNPEGWKILAEGMVDQKELVKTHLALPVTTYSIKEVAPVFGFHWRAEDAGGLNSESWYGEWLKSGDRQLLQKILDYNLDDVVAMEVVDKAIDALMSA